MLLLIFIDEDFVSFFVNPVLKLYDS